MPSIDEKTGMQALERKHRDRPSAPGDVAGREFEYVRQGTQTLIASFEVATGRVLATCRCTRKADDLLRFMHEVAAAGGSGPHRLGQLEHPPRRTLARVQRQTRWPVPLPLHAEPLPIDGDLEATLAAVVEMLGPYLEPPNSTA